MKGLSRRDAMLTEERFTTLARKYMDTVFRVAYSFLKNSADAEDVDLVSLAESVYLTGKTPPTDETALAAIDQLGDWGVTRLPEGYEPYFSQGAPAPPPAAGMPMYTAITPMQRIISSTSSMRRPSTTPMTGT